MENTGTKTRVRMIQGHTLLYDGPPRVDQFDGSWHRTVFFDGHRYRASVCRGKRVRLAYSNRVGYQWIAFLRNAEGSTVYTGDVKQSTGVVGILVRAGLLDDDKSKGA